MLHRSFSRPAKALIACGMIIAGTSWNAANAGSTQHIHATQQTISIEFHNHPLRSALLEVAHRFHVSVALTDQISGYVSVDLHQATLDATLAALLNPLGYTYTKHHGVVFIQRSTASNTPNTSSSPSVIPLSVISPDQAMHVLHTLYPQASISADHHANALVVLASSDELIQMKSLLQGIDIKNPSDRIVNAIVLHTLDAHTAIARLSRLFPHASFSSVGKDRIVISAIPSDQTQIASIMSTLDAPPSTPAPIANTTDVVHLVQIRATQAARTAALQFPHLRVGVNGDSVVLRGSADDVSQAKTLLTQLDVPGFSTRVSVVHRLHAVDAQSVADLLKRSFRDIECYVDHDLNAVAITATVGEQNRINDAIAQLDSTASNTNGGMGNSGSGAADGGFEVITLRSAMPAQGGSSGGSADMATSIISTMQQVLPSVKVIALASPGQLAVIGDPYNVRLAKQYISQLDVLPPLVVLDTKLFEMDVTAARNLGLELPTPVLSSTFSEFTAQSDTTNNTRIGRIQPFTRTPLSLQTEFNLLIQDGTARVLADPRITTLSGHTATIRAGDTIGILTTVGGGTGTYATSQIQTFQTGVTLDITPLVTPDNEVTVALHPVVNSLSGIVNGVPQISTRDTETTVHLKDNQTLVIGGLIEESVQKSVNKVPLLGNLPLLGQAFQNPQSSTTRNELVIVVTPHIINGDDASGYPAPTAALSSPLPLPTLPPDTALPMTQTPPSPPPVQQMTPRPTVNHSTPISVGVPASIAAPAIAATGTPSATPTATPTAVNMQTQSLQNANNVNSFAYGQVPSSNIASATDPVRIFYAAMSPTSIHLGGNVNIAATTTTNAANVTLAIGSASLALLQGNPGVWSLTGQLPVGAVSSSQTSFNAMLTATRNDGSAASIVIPVQIVK